MRRRAAPTVRWLRSHPELALLPLGLLALLSVGFSFSIGIVGFLAMVTASALAIGWVFRRWPGRQEGRLLHLRVMVQVAALTLLTYATGWGPALGLVFLLAVADNVRHSGSGAARVAFDWSLVAIALGQLGIQLDLVPSFLEAPAVHGVAVTSALVLAAVVQRIHLMSSQKEAAEADIAAREQRFRSLVSQSSDVILVVDEHNRIAYQSPSATALGYRDDQLLGQHLTQLVHPDDRETLEQRLADLVATAGSKALIEARLRSGDDRWVVVESNCRNLLHDGDVRGVVVSSRDVTDRKDLEAELQHRAFHDSLTGLANRHLFRDRVDHAIARGLRHTEPFAVLFLDLDGFKAINDTLGHQAGDQLLHVVAGRLRRAIRDHDTAARLGGDEFAVLLEDMKDRSDAARVAERIFEELRKPILVDGARVTVDGSIGIAVSEAGSRGKDAYLRNDTDALLRNADIAMYMAKNAGKGRYELFEPSMHVAVVERLKLESDLARAIDEDQLELYYQPIVTLDDAEIVGVEALLRWHHPERGMISPAEFIPLAEETGLIIPIGRWVLREACTQVRRWQQQFPHRPALRVSVNVAVPQLTSGAIAADVATALRLSGLPAEHLTLEITESALVTDIEGSHRLFSELKTLGVRLAIDDFGTGYSSLAYLQDFPFDVLKIDRSFIEGVTTGEKSPAVVRAIVELGRSLKLATVAEGIERDDQLTRFRELHCNYGQGYLFARPSASGELETLLTERFGAAPLVISDGPSSDVALKPVSAAEAEMLLESARDDRS